MLVNTIAIVPITASKINFRPISTPMAATHHTVPAVFIALTLFSSMAIIPAPRKPMPDITWAGILIKSSSYELNDADTNKKEPRHTIILVRSPALLPLISLSNPTIKLKIIQTIKRRKK